MKKERKVWAITLIALWWLAPSKIMAQQDSLRNTRLDQVVVTATKFPKSQLETGKVVSIIDEEQIRRSSGKDISQLLNEQTGLIVNGANSNPGKDKSIFLRGASSQYTLILLDGIPVNDPSAVGSVFDLRLLPIDQVERIEVLKGSQSTLYGSDAIAGVINIITKQKGRSSFGGFGAVNYGSYNTLKANAGISGVTEKIDYNVSFTRYQTDGISEAEDLTGTANFDKDGVTQNAFGASVGFKPSAAFTLRPYLRMVDFNGKYDAGPFTDDTTAVYDAKLLNYGLTGLYKFDKGTLNLQYGRAESDRAYSNTFGNFAYFGRFDNAELFVNRDLSENFQLLGGINFQNLKMNDEAAVKKNPSMSITSPYLSLFVRNLSGFSAEVGGRYNSHSVFGNVFTYSINPSYLINSQIKLFANYSTGFKAPTLNELYGQFGANENLKPQESKSLEGGVDLLLSKLSVRATVFSRKIDNVIIYGGLGYTNLDQQNDHGFEVEPTFVVNEKLTIRAFYAFVDGEVKTQTGMGTDTTYNNLIRKPKQSIGVNIGYNVTPRLFVSANLKTFGERYDNFFDPVTFTSSRIALPAYQLLDIYAEYRLMDERLRLFVDAKNILNQQYYEVYGYSTLGFNVNAGVSLSF